MQLATTTVPDTARQILALSRWTVGHQTFHLYLVAMITLLEELTECPSLSDEHIATRLSDLAVLFEATAASMRYASSFDAATYDQAIRPSMAPPVTKPGFSGSLSTEHKRMMAALVSVPDTLEERFGNETSPWPSAVADAWCTLVEAEREARSNHAHVCRRLVPRGPSLLRMHMAGSGALKVAGDKTPSERIDTNG